MKPYICYSVCSSFTCSTSSPEPFRGDGSEMSNLLLNFFKILINHYANFKTIGHKVDLSKVCLNEWHFFFSKDDN